MVEPTSSSFLTSPLGLGAIQFGAGFAESLAKQIFGSGDRKRILRFAEMLKSRMGQDIIDPQRQRAIVQQLYNANAPERNRNAEMINKRLNLDSGVAQGELANQAQQSYAGLAGNLALQNESMKFNRDNQYQQMIQQIYGSLL